MTSSDQLKKVICLGVGIKLEWLMDEDKIRAYESVKTSLPLIFNRLRLFGDVPQKKRSPFLLSILDHQQDVIWDCFLNKEQFDYLKKALKLKVVPTIVKEAV